MVINGNVTSNNDEITRHIKDFYTDLYNQRKEEPGEMELNNILSGLPALNDNEAQIATSQISILELTETIKHCTDSSPGPDGIPYSILKLVWPTYSKILLNAWNYSQETNITKRLWHKKWRKARGCSQLYSVRVSNGAFNEKH